MKKSCLTFPKENISIESMENISHPITLETLLGGRKYILIREELQDQLLFYDEEKEGFYRIILSKGKKYTAEDYKNLPEGSPFQLIEGELVYMGTPNPKHQEISGKLHLYIGMHLLNNPIGKVYFAPLSVKFDDENVVEPDILFVSIQKKSIITEKGIEGAPEFVVEILSDVAENIDKKSKDTLQSVHTMYGNFGVEEYWIINPKQETVEVYYNRLSIMIKQQTAHIGDTIKSKAIQGFELEVSKLF